MQQVYEKANREICKRHGHDTWEEHVEATKKERAEYLESCHEESGEQSETGVCNYFVNELGQLAIHRLPELSNEKLVLVLKMAAEDIASGIGPDRGIRPPACNHQWKRECRDNHDGVDMSEFETSWFERCENCSAVRQKSRAS